MTIIGYENYKNMTIRFDDSGYIRDGSYDRFKEGSLKSPYCKSVCHQGYLGEGSYKPKVDGNLTKQYVAWKSMLRRCYSDKYQKTRPTYIGCLVIEEWHNFQTFAKWYDENYYEVESDSKRGMNLDKDILNKGNKIYCPEYCVYAPDRINLLFIKVDAVRGSLPVGVNKEKYGKRYSAYCSKDGKREEIGLYNTPEEAFNAYKTFKESYIKQVAEDYKNIIPTRLYEALYRYEISITD